MDIDKILIALVQYFKSVNEKSWYLHIFNLCQENLINNILEVGENSNHREHHVRRHIMGGANRTLISAETHL